MKRQPTGCEKQHVKKQKYVPFTESLRTIDNRKEGTLLPIPQQNTTDLTVTQRDGCSVVDNVLSAAECKMIVENAGEIGFTNVSHSYLPSTRQAERLVVVDNNLATLLQQRLQPVISGFQQVQPFGFYTTSPCCEWKFKEINSCHRLSRYIGPSVGFKPHRDSQFCASTTTRSIFSVVVFLTAEVDQGGGTVFLEAPSGGGSGQQVVAGETIGEEIARLGGLSQFKQHRIAPKVGSVVIFPHQALHLGEALQKGTKVVLRTDLIYHHECQRKHSPTFCSRLSLGEQTRLRECAENFREAQNCEIEGEVEEASQLYERALSLRIGSRSTSSSTGGGRSEVVVVGDIPQDCWNVIFSWLNLIELRAVSGSCSLMSAFCEVYHNTFWDTAWLRCNTKTNNNRKTHQTPNDTNRPSEKRKHPLTQNHDNPNNETEMELDTDKPTTAKKNCTILKNLYIPLITERYGTIVDFEFPSAEFFLQHKEECLRVVGMYTCVLFGHKKDGKVYIAEYDPVQGTVLGCSRDYLLSCAFYGVPCGGSVWHVADHEQTKKIIEHDLSDDEDDWGDYDIDHYCSDSEIVVASDSENESEREKDEEDDEEDEEGEGDELQLCDTEEKSTGEVVEKPTINTDTQGSVCEGSSSDTSEESSQHQQNTSTGMNTNNTNCMPPAASGTATTQQGSGYRSKGNQELLQAWKYSVDSVCITSRHHPHIAYLQAATDSEQIPVPSFSDYFCPIMTELLYSGYSPAPNLPPSASEVLGRSRYAIRRINANEWYESETFKKNKHHHTSFGILQGQEGRAEQCACGFDRCFHGTCDNTTVNNLIFDFSRYSMGVSYIGEENHVNLTASKPRVADCAPCARVYEGASRDQYHLSSRRAVLPLAGIVEHWQVTVTEGETGFKTFNHASCYCGTGGRKTADVDKVFWNGMRALDHVHLFVSPPQCEANTVRVVASFVGVTAF